MIFLRSKIFLGTVGFFLLLLVLSVLGGIWLQKNIMPAQRGQAEEKFFLVNPGESFWRISSRLADERLIRSKLAFEILSLIKGSAVTLKPGLYKFSTEMSASEILDYLIKGSRREVEVVIFEGDSVYEIDKVLSEKEIIPRFELIKYSSKNLIEGQLFPDTYKFFTNSKIEEVVNKLLSNFEKKAAPLLKQEPERFRENLILASLIEKEVPNFEEARIAAGILKKRLKVGMPLQVDATICYIKKILSPQLDKGCYPLDSLDFKIDSPYNTYLYRGLPPAPIANPGIRAIKAVLDAKDSPFWFYLSDPLTKKTIFSKTFEEHSRNRRIYLGSK